ncbi:hypothetical protein A3Q56_00055 [Intoshia linei]|uniref:Uncharacterized protein n=1 Tax=Intoshia linei TaxID=1819745 RepID=A0A177BD81_9BILA|nr:hypothetical protein A3Q56_00055 [Intoshia linei]
MINDYNHNVNIEKAKHDLMYSIYLSPYFHGIYPLLGRLYPGKNISKLLKTKEMDNVRCQIINNIENNFPKCLPEKVDKVSIIKKPQKVTTNFYASLCIEKTMIQNKVKSLLLQRPNLSRKLPFL